MLASQNGHTKVVKLLHEYCGAKIDLQTEDGWTALMCASENGQAQVVHLLHRYGAQLDLTDNEGWTALMFAFQNGHDKVVKLLCQHNRDMIVSDSEAGAVDRDGTNEHTTEVVAILQLQGDVQADQSNNNLETDKVTAGQNVNEQTKLCEYVSISNDKEGQFLQEVQSGSEECDFNTATQPEIDECHETTECIKDVDMIPERNSDTPKTEDKSSPNQTHNVQGGSKIVTVIGPCLETSGSPNNGTKLESANIDYSAKPKTGSFTCVRTTRSTLAIAVLCLSLLSAVVALRGHDRNCQLDPSVSVSRPTLDMLLSLWLPNDTSPSIVKEIGNNYKQFGILLLKSDISIDKKGEEFVEDEEQEVTRIITQILCEWLEGNGLNQTWGTLLKVLETMELNEAAEHMACSVNYMFGEHQHNKQ